MKELIKQLPSETIVYFGDTARVPYGTKSKDAIIQYSFENTRILLEKNVKMVVVACNSSSSYALPWLRKEFDIPILGVINPGARKAVEVTRTNKIGVIATSATIHSRSYNRALKKCNRRVSIHAQACPLFVPLVESGWFNKKVSTLIAEEYLGSLKKAGIDALVLGCTHYPLLKNIIKKVMGPKVFLVDSAKEVAHEVKEVLKAKNLRRTRQKIFKHTIMISDEPQGFEKIARNFLNNDKIRYKLYKQKV